MTANTCARGCTIRHRHATGCPDRDDCNGCQPREATHGHLCYPCHKRLEEMLRWAPEQCNLLDRFATMNAAPVARGDADLIHGTGEIPTPIRLACVDARQLIGDLLSEVVERLVEDYQMRGPVQLQTQAERDGTVTQYMSWHPSIGYHWTEPPTRFTVESAAPWLRAQIVRLEHLNGIEDTWQELANAMSQAHALAPWREQATRMNGIPCPECKRMGLVLFGGDENVSCTVCHASITPGRYTIWCRMLEEEASA